jgi:hypothetical protein
MLKRIINLFKRTYVKPKGVLLYKSVQEVIRIQKFLEAKGFSARLIAPPPEFRVGCDLAIEFDLLEQEAVETALKTEGNPPVKIVSTKEMLPDILRRSVFVELDGYLMSKAGNMKITVSKMEERIVNISGGGCPDIPFVAQELNGKRINEAADPIALGNSLCAYMLQIAFDALKKRMVQCL